ncbi:cardiolipin synthase ClsB [Cupriavidus metallidurans]|uniref:cardiolipin synthase ClsB n=1 Tax=Cupriavidus metallidurans TaxID=119219 RepID=UPI001CCAC7BA|nr:cardiolipin synthase ClsB [Cupriavidus metallidurans]UBM11395.1 cardiolipin synthase ClsB [Cupriavidus metallidurans]
MSRINDRVSPPTSSAPGTPESPSSALHQEVGDPAATTVANATAPLMRWVRRRGSPVQGNLVDLLSNGQEYFPALIEAIDAARVHVVLETYIYADDDVGALVTDALIRAAQRGVDVRLVVDGFGAGDLPATLASRLRDGGVRLEVFRPVRGFRLARRHLRRLHRKMAVIDDSVAFVGGINIIDDHNYGPLELPEVGPRYDFAVRVRGPLVAQIALASARLWFRMAQQRGLRETATAFTEVETLTTAARQARREHHAGGVAAALLLRDNLRNRRTIEREYLYALGAARHDVIIANAYFLPGTKMRRALLACRERGVRVRLLLQGMVEYRLQHFATHALYARLLEAGIEIYEYEASFLHAKVAVIDNAWATVGSSNLDPFSLLLAREANVAVYDPSFAGVLRARLERAMAQRSARVVPEVHARLPRLRRFANWAAYYVLRLGVVIAGVTGRY